MTHADACEATSPIVFILQALRARQPKWSVDIGQPHGPGWIPGTALVTATEGPFLELLGRIGDGLQTSDRRTIAASFALRYGWSSGVAFAPYLLYACVPTITLGNVSFRFNEQGSFERAALHHPVGVMLFQEGTAPHPSIEWLSDPQALFAWLRTSLVQQAQPVVDALAAWSQFSVRGIWGMITSAWGSLCVHIFGEIGEQTRGLTLDATVLRGDRCDRPNAATILSGDVPTCDARVSPRGQLLSVLPPAPGALLCRVARSSPMRNGSNGSAPG